MTETEENVQVGGSFVDSKFWRLMLMIIAVFLIFVGPTYIPYLLSDILKVDYFASIAGGAVLFIVGMIVMLFPYSKEGHYVSFASDTLGCIINQHFRFFIGDFIETITCFIKYS